MVLRGTSMVMVAQDFQTFVTGTSGNDAATIVHVGRRWTPHIAFTVRSIVVVRIARSQAESGRDQAEEDRELECLHCR